MHSVYCCRERDRDIFKKNSNLFSELLPDTKKKYTDLCDNTVGTYDTLVRCKYIMQVELKHHCVQYLQQQYFQLVLTRETCLIPSLFRNVLPLHVRRPPRGTFQLLYCPKKKEKRTEFLSFCGRDFTNPRKQLTSGTFLAIKKHLTRSVLHSFDHGMDSITTTYRYAGSRWD
jgi:hypothetical protein